MYFNYQEMIKEEKGNISRDKAYNPRFSGKHHTEKSKQAISMSQLKRYNTIRDYLDNGLKRLTEEDVQRICRDTLDEYIRENTVKVNKKII